MVIHVRPLFGNGVFAVNGRPFGGPGQPLGVRSPNRRRYNPEHEDGVPTRGTLHNGTDRTRACLGVPRSAASIPNGEPHAADPCLLAADGTPVSGLKRTGGGGVLIEWQ